MEGQSTDLEIHAREAIRQRRRMEVLVAEHTGQPLERITTDLDRDFILTAEEAKAYGVVDEVVSRKQVVAVRRPVALEDGRQASSSTGMSTTLTGEPSSALTS